MDEAARVSCEQPFTCEGLRREIRLPTQGQNDQLIFYYTPLHTDDDELPMLLCVYPGPADLWESVSLPLVMENYAVIAAGPPYSFALDAEVDNLQYLLAAARNGRFPASDRNCPVSIAAVRVLPAAGEPAPSAVEPGPGERRLAAAGLRCPSLFPSPVRCNALFQAIATACPHRLRTGST